MQLCRLILLIPLVAAQSNDGNDCEGDATDGCGPKSTTKPPTTTGSGGEDTTTTTTQTPCEIDPDTTYCIPPYGAANDFVTNKAGLNGQCNTINECNGGLDCYQKNSTTACNKVESAEECTCQKVPCTSTGKECTGMLECRQEKDDNEMCGADDEKCFCKLSFHCKNHEKKESCEACGLDNCAGMHCAVLNGKCAYKQSGAGPVATVFFALIVLLW